MGRNLFGETDYWWYGPCPGYYCTVLVTTNCCVMMNFCPPFGVNKTLMILNFVIWNPRNDFKLFTLIGMRKFSNEIRNYFIDRKKDKKLLIWAFNYDLLNGTIIWQG